MVRAMRTWIMALALVTSAPLVGAGQLAPWPTENPVAGLVQDARKGDGKAALCLAKIYERGWFGLRHDRREAYRWLHVARVLGEDTSMGPVCPPAPPFMRLPPHQSII